jgi:putative addiction module killer protein
VAILAMSGLFLGSGVFESRIDVGPGYRVYDQQKGSKLIILLSGGDKSSQARDIEEALMLSRQIKEDG